ncbi:glycoside hydrolase [Micromonospora sp. DR5-3]|uniref:WD40/YVTN/BNR-like repeat-containing protein n=1 Tax=unclassified Micromonospora TaxID=2617518 RepID=UPI0011D6B534|nr:MULTISPECIES: sialidase family protein [unclassified Micromonospora]MCW3816313.1 glycoside hydrolase [Micromonospora sp. DR5-3]TYC23891.1 exo-alpha-sialidase [Micromonospora sp. MP36]
MSDPHLRDVDVTDLDLPGLSHEVNQAFRPHFADVEARARRIRRTRVLGAAAVAVGVLLAGGTATVAARHDAAPTPATRPSPSIGPWTADWHGSSRTPAPQPSYVQVTPGHYDVAEPDKPLTGMFTRMMVGDLDHLYLEYQDCQGGRCTRMLAASADRGRTWRKLRMPEGLIVNPKYGTIVAAHGTTLVARDNMQARMRQLPEEQRKTLFLEPDTYWVSIDAGATWRRPTIRTADALPVGWPHLNAGMQPLHKPMMVAFDPATGDIALAALPRVAHEPPLELPHDLGLWIVTDEAEPIPSPLPSGGFTRKSWPIVMVSRDGGRTWDKRRLPEEISAPPPAGWGFRSDWLHTADGRTVYALEKRDKRVRVHVSTDGAATWRTGAEVDLGGPLLTVLPTREGSLILASDTATWRSTDQAASFTRVGPSLGSGAYALPGGGYAITTNNNEYSVWLSPDGSKWSYVGRPEVP